MVFTGRESVKQFLESYIQDMMDECDDDAYECTHQELVEDIRLYAESQDKHISTATNNSLSLDAQKKLKETGVVPESAFDSVAEDEDKPDNKDEDPCDLKYARASK